MKDEKFDSYCKKSSYVMTINRSRHRASKKGIKYTGRTLGRQILNFKMNPIERPIAVLLGFKYFSLRPGPDSDHLATYQLHSKNNNTA